MSEKESTGHGGGGRGRGRYQQKKLSYTYTPKSFISPVAGIESDTFNTGHPKFASQFKTSRRNVANFIQMSLNDEGHVVVKTIKTGEIESIPRPPAVPNGTDEDQRLSATKTYCEMP